MIQDALPYSSDDIQYTINGEYAGYPTSLIIYYVLEDSIMQGTGSMAFDIPYGKYIAIAYGMEDGTFNLTGNYATLEFEYADPHVPAAYDEFLDPLMIEYFHYVPEYGAATYLDHGLGFVDAFFRDPRSITACKDDCLHTPHLLLDQDLLGTLFFLELPSLLVFSLLQVFFALTFLSAGFCLGSFTAVGADL